jgi:pyruvate ferredoxin oxidoreductase gamma subunit/2-oxoisovalerate ferredoxin oxidoreductase gamma subunit
MVGAFSRVLGMPSLEAIVEAIEEEIPIKTENNIKAAKDAFKKVELLGPVKNLG